MNILPSVLLSEGYCPIEHGPLDRDKFPGWCTNCGLVYIVYPSETEWGNFVEMQLELCETPPTWVETTWTLDRYLNLSAHVEQVWRDLVQRAAAAEV